MGRNKKPISRIDSTKIQDIKYVFRHFEIENKVKKQPLTKNQLYKKVAKILHVSRVCVLDVINNKRVANDGVHEPKIHLDNFAKQLIKRTVFDMYSDRTLSTVSLIQDKIKDTINICDSILKKTLIEMGFCWRRTTDNLEEYYKTAENIFESVPPVMINLNSDEEDQTESDSEPYSFLKI